MNSVIPIAEQLYISRDFYLMLVNLYCSWMLFWLFHFITEIKHESLSLPTEIFLCYVSDIFHLQSLELPLECYVVMSFRCLNSFMVSCYIIVRYSKSLGPDNSLPLQTRFPLFSFTFSTTPSLDIPAVSHLSAFAHTISHVPGLKIFSPKSISFRT